ncbi:MAG: VRR-NUC domain-containing protein [Arcicella sp.]|nr:VRR-NUC domain-containing protein [Arcicella sp.]
MTTTTKKRPQCWMDRKAIKPSNKKTDQLRIEDICLPDANSTTTSIITYLNYNGFHVWRNNTHGVYDVKKQVFRKLQYQQRGVSDIIGYRKKDAKFIAIEVKIGTDTMSEEQEGFLIGLKESTGISMVAQSFDDFLKRWEYRKANGMI